VDRHSRADVLGEDVLTNKHTTLTWEDVSNHSASFINEVQEMWRNTKSLLHEVRSDSSEVCEYSVADALASLGLADLQASMTKEQLSEQILVAILDEKFLRYLRACESNLETIKVCVADEDLSTLTAHIIKNLGCTELMAAAGRWRQDRLHRPEKF